ncbi:hypothetical protein P691DRAFT_671138 [Macrolepiota fuliginosa MF-IS2]|uniref:Tetraspanin n=1 Tax=Macrolepiota fuliginosa MF-IS2 TaxID=1400762 RepID=A0A9P5XD31_9AGAR|nr:hypothetical protein P691DRAFT_671138 [Macrolepiota fuliginosa MF-IS2]
MAYVRSRKFCCCIPVRFGVFLLSFLGMGGGILLSVLGWWSIALIIPVSKPDEIALYFSSVMYTLLALVSLFGFAGAIIKSIRMVASFASALLVHLVFSVGIGIYAIYTVFKQDPQDIFNKCVGNAGDAYAESICKDSFAIIKGVTIAVYIITWLLQLYAYFVVLRYVEQLEHEESLKRQVIDNILSRPAPINVTTYSAFGSATQPRSAFVNGTNRV